MSRPVSKCVCCLLSTVVAFSCMGALEAQQAPQPQALAEATAVRPANLPYAARITGDQVNVRSGPAQVYYPVTTLDRGERIIVLEEMFGWAKIKPTKGSFSYIAKEFVDRADAPAQDGSPAPVNDALELFNGIVNADHVRVRAGSIKVPPAHADEVQTKLDMGAAVKVIGQRDDYYKILCPKNCYFWVSLKFIKRVGPVTEAVAEGIEQPAGEAASSETESEPGVLNEAPPEENLLSPEDLNRQAYQQVADLLDAQLDKPMLERNFEPILSRVSALIGQTSLPATKTSFKALERHVKRADLALRIWKRSQQQDEKLKVTLAKINSKIEKVIAINALPTKRDQAVFVKGRLTNSAVFTATHKNRRFLVLDAKDRIIYYAISAKADMDLALWVGRDVSLVGQVTYDTFSKSRLLHVISVVELPRRAGW